MHLIITKNLKYLCMYVHVIVIKDKTIFEKETIATQYPLGSH